MISSLLNTTLCCVLRSQQGVSGLAGLLTGLTDYCQRGSCCGRCALRLRGSACKWHRIEAIGGDLKRCVRVVSGGLSVFDEATSKFWCLKCGRLFAEQVYHFRHTELSSGSTT